METPNEITKEQIINYLSNLKRYNCDIEMDEDDDGADLVISPEKNGSFVKWSDIELILKK